MSFSKSKGYDWNISWNNKLKEIGRLLPITETASGRSLNQKETFLHMLAYLDCIQRHIEDLERRLPAHCLLNKDERAESEPYKEDTTSEPSTSQHLLNLKCTYARLCKKTTIKQEPVNWISLSVDEKDEEDFSENRTVATNRDSFLFLSAEESMWLEKDNSLPGSALDQELQCQGLGGHFSVSQEICSSADDSPASTRDLKTPPLGSFLVEDPMLGFLPSLGVKQFPESPTLPHTPVLLAPPILEAGESLNISPSLLTSPARGLCHPLMPKEKEELQSLFEDVWLSPNPSIPKEASSQHSSSDESHYQDVRDSLDSSQTEEEEDRDLDDVTWSQKQHVTLKRAKRCSRSQAGLESKKKKKCLNGFIMFCSMNRKLYVRTFPGTQSTVVTKELANLWHALPKKERRMYCLKARRISFQQNRLVVSNGQEKEEEEEMEECNLRPLHVLLAYRDLQFSTKKKS